MLFRFFAAGSVRSFVPCFVPQVAIVVIEVRDVTKIAKLHQRCFVSLRALFSLASTASILLVSVVGWLSCWTMMSSTFITATMHKDKEARKPSPPAPPEHHNSVGFLHLPPKSQANCRVALSFPDPAALCYSAVVMWLPGINVFPISSIRVEHCNQENLRAGFRTATKDREAKSP